MIGGATLLPIRCFINNMFPVTTTLMVEMDMASYSGSGETLDGLDEFKRTI